MPQLTYRDFQQRISIQDLLVDAGYTQNLKDGKTYPSYSKGKGDKFIVTRNGLACFRPPEQKCYNIISFIKSFPENFSDYTIGMDKDRLVNLVCNRILNNPIEKSIGNVAGKEGTHDREPFDIGDYSLVRFKCGNKASEMQFYPYFHNRGIYLNTTRAFSDNFFLATRVSPSGKVFTNLSFPLTEPAKEGESIVGLEERSRPNAEGKSAYKGLARNSDATNGIWIGRPSNGMVGSENDASLSEIKDVFWFESALDAMAFYQEKCRPISNDFTDYSHAVYLSTSGSPSPTQIKSVLRECPNAMHHLCFDNDRAGHLFSLNFALARSGHAFQTMNDGEGKLLVHDHDTGIKATIDLFDSFESSVEKLGITNDLTERHLPDNPHKDWNEQAMARMEEIENHARMRR